MELFQFSANEVLNAQGEIFYNHKGRESTSGAFEINEQVTIKLNLPRSLAATRASIIIFDGSENASLVCEQEVLWCGLKESFDVYETKFSKGALSRGIFFFIIKIDSPLGVVYGYKGDRNSIFFAKETLNENRFQLLISDFLYDAPQNIYGGIIYHIFVDRFNRGKKQPFKAGTVFVNDWSAEIPEFPEYPGAHLKNNYFYGGTLDGIAEKLEYISALGVTVIYLSPIFEAASNHKYDTADYMSIDAMFGGEKAFLQLVKKAKTYGIQIILDGVFNHTGSDSIYFNMNSTYGGLGAYQSKESPYYQWYDFKSHPDEYTCWWGVKILPRINPDVPECSSYFIGDDGVIEKYAKMGIFGFRLDVVDELSDSFISGIKNKLAKTNNNSILYGEVWEDASNKISYGKRKQYFLGNELDGVMNYPIRTGLIAYFRDRRTQELSYALSDIIDNAPKRVRDASMNLLGSHDTIRAITALGGESPDGKTNAYLSNNYMTQDEYRSARKKLKSAYTVLATIPGVPSIYYGDEVGLQGYSDPFNRRTFPWGKEDLCLLEYYKKIGVIRRTNPIYRDGEFKLLHLDEDMLVYSRYDSKQAYLTFVNNSSENKEIIFSDNAVSLITEKRAKLHVVESFSSEIFKVSRNTTIEF